MINKNEHPLENTQINRRDFNKLMVGAGSAMAISSIVNTGHQLVRHPQEYGYYAGKVIDKIHNPEDLMPEDDLTILLPREDNTPKVEIDTRSEKYTNINAEVFQEEADLMIEIDLNESHGRFSKQKLTNSNFVCAGVAVVTSAMGIDEGHQEFCMLSRNEKNEYIAVGYDHGTVFRFDENLKEWEELIGENEDEKEVSLLSANNAWEQLNDVFDIFDTHTLLEWVNAGNKVFKSLDYEPFGALSPELLPRLSYKVNIGPEKTAKNLDEVLNYKLNKIPFMVTEAGMLMDLEHLAEKSQYAMSVLAQLKIIEAQRKKSNLKQDYDVSLFQGTTTSFRERFHFSVEDNLFNTHSLEDITQMVMCLYTTATEGIMQRDIVLAAQSVGLGKDRSSGLSPEDSYTNTVSTSVTLATLANKEDPISVLFEQEVSELINNSDGMSSTDIGIKCDEIYLKLMQKNCNIREKVLTWVYKNWGIKAINRTYKNLAYGIYHAIGMKVGHSNEPIPQLPLSLPDSTQGVKISYLPDFSVSIPTALK